MSAIMFSLPQFLSRIGLSRAPQPVPAALYGAVVAQSRNPAFYTIFGVPDTVAGRFALLCLHMFLLTRRFALDVDRRASALSQDVFDCFTVDLDRALREMGVGDTSVPKRKRRMIHGYYGQIDDFADSLERGETAVLEQKIADRFFQAKPDARAARLARYIQASDSRLRQTPFAGLAAGEVSWPMPDAAS